MGCVVPALREDGVSRKFLLLNGTESGTGSLAAQAPVRLLLRHPGEPMDYRITLHEWRPDGGAYEVLPEDLAAASQRRAERVALEVVPRDSGFTQRSEPDHGLGAFCLDLRWLPG